MTLRNHLFLAVSGILAVAAFSAAEEQSVQPYIDQLKKGMGPSEKALPPPTPESPDPYAQSIKRKMTPQPTIQKEGESYIDALKRYSGPEQQPVQQPSYTEQERTKLAPAQTGGAIQALKEGRSQLKARKEGEIHQAIGVRLGPSFVRDISADSETQLRPFNDLYSQTWAPEIGVFYEFQPFHSEWLGNVGVVGMSGLGYYHGNGLFAHPPLVAGSNFTPRSSLNGATFGSSSGARFQFFTIPAIAALDYRFNLLRFLRPFVMAGPGFIAYLEKRGDTGDTMKGISRELFTSGGVAILLDWMSPRSAWDLYAESGVKHYYVTLEYSRFFHLGGDVSFAMSGISAGLTFEY